MPRVKINGRKDEQCICSQTADVRIKIMFRVTTGSFHSFQIGSIEMLWIIIYIQSIWFWIWFKESTSVVNHLDQ